VFCPLCQAEFEGAIANCPNCGAHLSASKEEAEELSPRIVLWQGNHPGFCEDLDETLAEGHVLHYSERCSGDLRYRWPLDQPRFRVYVLASDFDRAKGFLSVVESEFTTDESASIGLEDAIQLKNSRHAPTFGDWQPDATAVEVWSGKDSDLADFLRESLKTNDIEFRTRIDSGKRQELDVHAADADRAREIIREVVEGTPPE